jgi:hypothetical protein
MPELKMVLQEEWTDFSSASLDPLIRSVGEESKLALSMKVVGYPI